MDDDFFDLTPDEERLLELLVEYDEALADGTCVPGTTPTPPDLGPELVEQFEEGQRLLEMLARIREFSALGQQPDPSAKGPPADAASWIDTFETLRAILGGKDLSVPRQLGRFVVLRELGRGGHGFVLLAHDPILKRHVALKLPRAENLLSRSLRRRFVREAQAAARLTHPNVVSVYEVGEIGPTCYIASAYCAGPTLSEWLSKRQAAVPPLLAARIIEQLALALQYAHEQGVLHRDLKPSNVLLEPLFRDESTAVVPSDTDEGEFVPKVTDFGLAKLVEESDGMVTRDGCTMGTPAYMSPEQASGNLTEVGAATDVYALGAMLYELLLGEQVFRGATDLEILHKVLVDDPAPLRRIRRTISADLEAICLKCLEKKPADRYASCAALADDLQQFMTARPTCARPLSSAQRLVRWASRNRSLAALWSVVMALLLCITTLATVVAIRDSQARGEAERIAALEHDAREQVGRSLVAEQHSLAIARRAEQQAQHARQAAESEAATTAKVSEFIGDLFLTADPIGMGRLGFREGDEIGRQLTLQKLLDRGAARAEKALGDSPLARAKLLDTLGRVYSNLGEMERAEPLLREAFTLRQQQPDQEADLATSLLNMGTLYRWKGEYVEADRALQQAMDIRVRLFGADHLSVAEVEFASAWTVIEMERFGRMHDSERWVACEKLLQNALEVQRRQLGSHHRDVGLTLTLYTLYLYFSQRGPEAQSMLIVTAGVVMQQEEGQALGRALLDYQRGSYARSQKRITAAEEHYRASLASLRTVLGKGHPVNLLVLADLAGMLRQQGRMADAEVLVREALEISFRVFPQGHPQIITLLQEAADVVETQGKYDEAFDYVEKKMAIEARYQSIPVSNRLRDMLRTANIRLNQGRLQETLVILADVRSELMKLDTTSDPHGKDLRCWHLWLEGAVEGARGHIGEQGRIGRECLQMAGISGDIVDTVEAGLATVILAQRSERPEASELLHEPVAGWSASLSTSKPQRVLRLLARSQVLIDEGKLDEAEPLLKCAHEFTHDRTIPGCYLIGVADSVLGNWLAAKGNTAEAESHLQAGLNNLRTSRGAYHQLTQAALTNLTTFYRQSGRSADAARVEAE